MQSTVASHPEIIHKEENLASIPRRNLENNALSSLHKLLHNGTDLEYHSVCPLVRIGTPPPPFCASRVGGGGGGSSPPFPYTHTHIQFRNS
jgi:hypothetical protein